MVILPSTRAVLPSLRRLLCLSGLLLLSSLPTISQAQITLDGSLGPRGALRGPNYVIPAAVGHIRGPNLFHSFDQFNLRLFQGESATFTGPNTIANILSRVTGGSPSIIDGLLRSQIPGAHLYLLNPSGVLFGPNARLAVSGSFHVSTADYLRLADGAIFAANPNPGRDSLLSVAPPAAFGFLGPTPAPMLIVGSTLQVPEEQTLSVIGGDVTVQPALVPSLRAPVLRAPRGRINLASVASAGEVVPHATDPAMPLQVDSFTRLGQLTLQNTFVDTSGTSGGTVVIRGGRLMLDAATVAAQTLGDVNGAGIGIDVAVAGDVLLTNSAAMATLVSGAGQGGAIHVTAGSMAVRNGSVVLSGTVAGSTGDGEDVAIAAPTLAVDGGGIAASTFGSGRAGDIRVEVEQLTLTNGAFIDSSTFGRGAGGGITITARQAITLAGQNQLGFRSGVTSFAGSAGAAGSLVIAAPTLAIDGGQLAASTTGAGRAGDIRIEVERMTLTNGGVIDSSTAAAGPGGEIAITAREMITLAGQDQNGSASRVTSLAGSAGAAGSLVIATSTLAVDGGRLATSTLGAGRAGDIRIEVGQLTLTNGGSVESDTFGPGAGGGITLTARQAITMAGSGVTSFTGRSAGAAGSLVIAAPILTVDGGLIAASTLGAGRAGDIQVQVGQLSLAKGAAIDSSTVGSGPGGSVMISATDILSITGRDGMGTARSGVFSRTLGTGAGGTVTVAASRLTIQEGGRIGAETRSDGRAGDVVVQVGHLSIASGGQINSGSGVTVGDTLVVGAGAGGTVTVTATDAAVITGSDSGLSARTAGQGQGGDVTLQARQIEIADSAIVTAASLGAGKAGSVTLRAQETVRNVGGTVTTNTQGSGDAGVVSIVAPTVEVADGRLSAVTSGMGKAGDVTVEATRVTLTGRAQIDSSSRGSGQGGRVTVLATEAMTLADLSEVSSNATSSGNAGIVSITTPVLTMMGNVEIAARTLGAGNAGDVDVHTGRLTLSGGAQIGSTSGTATTEGNLVVGPGQGGAVTVAATEAILLTGRDSTGVVSSGLFSQTGGPGDAGRVTVSAPQLTLADGGRIGTDTGGDGRAGDVMVQAGALTLSGGAQINSGSGITVGARLFVGAGAGGTVVLTATDAVTITGQDSGLTTSTRGAGRGGDVTLQAPLLTLTDGARLAAESTGGGAAGSVTVTAQDAVRLTGSTVTTSTQGSGEAGRVAVAAPTIELADGRLSAVTSGTGNAGSVVVEAARLTLSGQAQIDSSSSGPGQGGQVTITAREAITITGSGGLASNAASQGAAGTVTVTTPTLQMNGPVAIEARTTGDGDAGNVDVQSERVTLTGGARIGSTSGLADTAGTVMVGTGHGGRVTLSATDVLRITGQDSLGTPSGVFSQTFGPGDAGRVIVATPHLTLADGGRIGAETGGAGRGGDVAIQAGSLTLTSGAQINSSSGITTGAAFFVGPGAGGTVTVTATDPMTLSGQGSGLFTRTAGEGQGGDITLHAPRVELTDQAAISAESTGLGNAGNAGNITITTHDTFLLTNGSVVTRATQADGGNIQITAPTLVRLRDSAITAEVGGGASTEGGNITIDPQFVLLQNSQIVANAFEGRGGNIRIVAQQVFLADPASQVSASSALGINGQVNIQSPVTSISGAVAPLPQSFAQTAELLRTRCAERLREGTVSRFVVGGRDGVPLEPGGLLLSPLVQVGQEGGVHAGERQSHPPEAQPGRARYAQAPAPGGLEVECTKWLGQQGTTVTQKRRR